VLLFGRSYISTASLISGSMRLKFLARTAATPELATFNYKSSKLTPKLQRSVGCTGQKMTLRNREKLTVEFVYNF